MRTCEWACVDDTISWKIMKSGTKKIAQMSEADVAKEQIVSAFNAEEVEDDLFTVKDVHTPEMPQMTDAERFAPHL